MINFSLFVICSLSVGRAQTQWPQ